MSRYLKLLIAHNIIRVGNSKNACRDVPRFWTLNQTLPSCYFGDFWLEFVKLFIRVTTTVVEFSRQNKWALRVLHRRLYVYVRRGSRYKYGSISSCYEISNYKDTYLFWLHGSDYYLRYAFEYLVGMWLEIYYEIR